MQHSELDLFCRGCTDTSDVDLKLEVDCFSSGCDCQQESCHLFLNQMFKSRANFLSSIKDYSRHSHKTIFGCTFCVYNDVYVLHVCTQNVGIAELRNLKMQENMIIFCVDMSRFAKSFCVDEKIDVITVGMRMLNTSNSIFPVARKVLSKERLHLKRKYGDFKWFPRIKSTDPYMQYLGAKKKDIVKFFRKYNNEIQFVYYRKVI